MQHLFNHPKAMALIYGGENAPEVFGRVKFYQKGRCVLVVANIEGLPKTNTGFFGFHIHDGNACTGEDFADSKAHYNPQNAPHPAHAGDMPPLTLCGNKAHLEFLTDRIRINDIIGRAIIIHSDPDDFTTQPSGNAGTKIACGVIEKV